ncbi:MAG: ATP-binding cassette domain-containing protein [Planctomycetota bacterium]|jgi:ATPase subunit of ABC transporter with duplicated ATPase domains|nr:ATP-binding cassette domain-containing protein [Planctomycetota bacterium]
MLSVSELTVQFGEHPLFENVSLRLTAGNCYGIIGANGAGKSTFLNVLSGDLEPNLGTVSLDADKRMGVLRQHRDTFDDQRVLDVVVQGHSVVWKIQEQMDALYAKEDFSDADGEKVAALQEKFDELDGYSQESNAAEVLTNLGVKPALHDKLLGDIDDALKVRVLLAQAIFSRPDMLMLDEPTNNLDIETIAWLEQFLADYDGCIAVVSHDRHFLNRVCTHVLDVDFRTVRGFIGNWDVYAAQEALSRALRSKEKSRVDQQLDRLKTFVARFKTNAARSKQATSRQKQIDSLSTQKVAPSSRVAPRILFTQDRPSGQDVAILDKVSFAYEGGEPLLNKYEMRIDRGDRLAIVGRNGIGKTTLIRLLMGELQPTDGTLRLGGTVTTSYFPQDNGHLFTEDQDIVTWISTYAGSQDINAMRAMLGRMLFSGDDVKKSVKVLSGGEKVRCLLSMVMLQTPNLAVLDEPTNHLDLESIEALQEALQEFPGTLIFVSHDRQFVDAVANRVLVMSDEGLTDWRGTYSSFRSARGLE